MKLTILTRDDNDIFIMEERENDTPVMRGRCTGFGKLIERIGELTGVEITIDKYFGDYIAKAFSPKKES